MEFNQIPKCPYCKKEMFKVDTGRSGIERWECPCGVVTITTRFKGGRISD